MRFRSSRSGSAPWSSRPDPFANFILAIVIFTGLIFMSSAASWSPPVIGSVVAGQRRRRRPASSRATVSPRSTARAITDFEQLPQIISVSGGADLAIDLHARRPAI